MRHRVIICPCGVGRVELPRGSSPMMLLGVGVRCLGCGRRFGRKGHRFTFKAARKPSDGVAW